MSFNIYDLSPIDPDEFSGDVEPLDVIESGLSSGELRQALLDRLKMEIESQDVYFLNYSLKGYDFEIEDDFLEDECGRRSTIEDVENLLYEIDDEAISNTIWLFSPEIVYVKQEED